MDAAGTSGAAKQSMAAARSEMRELQKTVLNSKADYTSTSSDKLGKALDIANNNFTILKHDTRGAALDASCLSTFSMLGAEQAANLDTKTPEKFVKKLLAGEYGFSARTKVNWLKLASAVAEAGIYTPVPAPTFLLGKFVPPERKERKERKRKEASTTAPLQTAENKNVEELQEQEQDKAQTVRIRVLHATVKKHADEATAAGGPRRVNLFQLLLHPTSFSQTVENFFDFAFLVKDGLVRVTPPATCHLPPAACHLPPPDAHRPSTALLAHVGACAGRCGACGGGRRRQLRLLPEADCMYVVDSKKPNTDTYKGLAQARIQNILKLDHETYTALVAKWISASTPPLLASRGAAAAAGGGRGGGASKGAAAGPSSSAEAPVASASARKQPRH